MKGWQRDSEGRVTSVASIIAVDVKHRVTQALGDYRSEMKKFEKYAKHFKDDEFISDLKKVNDIIQKDDLKFSGFIVQEPTSKLLELRDNKNISRVDIINVDFDYMR